MPFILTIVVILDKINNRWVKPSTKIKSEGNTLQSIFNIALLGVSTTAFILSLLGVLIVGAIAGLFIAKILITKSLDKSKTNASKIL